MHHVGAQLSENLVVTCIMQERKKTKTKTKGRRRLSLRTFFFVRLRWNCFVLLLASRLVCAPIPQFYVFTYDFRSISWFRVTCISERGKTIMIIMVVDRVSQAVIRCERFHWKTACKCYLSNFSKRHEVHAPLRLRISLECGFPHKCPSYTSSLVHCIRPDHARRICRCVHQIVIMIQNIEPSSFNCSTQIDFDIYLRSIHGETVEYVWRPSTDALCVRVFALSQRLRFMIHFLIPNWDRFGVISSSFRCIRKLHCKQNPFKNTISFIWPWH